MLWILASEGGIKIGDFAVAETIANWIELAAVLAITIAVIAALVGALRTRMQSDWTAAFQTFKRYMGLGLLIGLDLLIAGDIIKTVTLDPTLENAAVLGLLVLIRTFLSWTIVVEVNGCWPWQSPPGSSKNEEL
jgi:uncharacterized membrane protein